MGFDLTALRPRKGSEEYYRASMFLMTILRCSMLAAGVKEKLIYDKFLSNEGYRVTPLQAATIAEKLRAWLKGRNLVIDLFESNERAMVVNEAMNELLNAIEGKKTRRTRKRPNKNRSTPVRVDRRLRREIRGFGEFCGCSGGFWIV